MTTMFEWEIVEEGGRWKTSRRRVPNGWLYLQEEFDPSHQIAMVFVPLGVEDEERDR